jgi:hypothetical protein
MSVVLLVAVSVLLLIGVAFVLLFRKLGSQADLTQTPENWLEETFTAKYRPMERLLADNDYRFLASLPGLPPALLTTMRAERRRIFRSYLGSLKEDFGRVYTATRLLMLHSEQDRPDLALELLRQRAVFTLGVLVAELHLVIHVMGFGGIPVHGLLGSLDSMRQNLTGLTRATRFASA